MPLPRVLAATQYNVVNSGWHASFDDALNNEVIENVFPTGFSFKTNVNVCYKEGSQATPVC